MPVRKLVAPDFGASIGWRTWGSVEEIVKRDMEEVIFRGYSARLIRVDTLIDQAAVVSIEWFGR